MDTLKDAAEFYTAEWKKKKRKLWNDAPL